MLAFAAGVLACRLSAADIPDETTSQTTNRSRSNFEDETASQLVVVEIMPGMRVNQLHFKAKLNSGSLAWKLRDPEGELIWQGELRAPDRINENKKLPATPGNWELEISLQNASGDYDVDWKSTK
jgi:hypothetical protein